MSLANIITGASNDPYVDISVRSISADSFETQSLIVGDGPRIGSSFLTVGSTSSAEGISFYNNIGGNIPAKFNTYTELTQTVTWTSTGGQTTTGPIYFRRIGGQVFITVGAFNIAHAGDTRYTSTAINSFYRPGGTQTYSIPVILNDTVIQGYSEVRSTGVIIIETLSGASSGARNGIDGWSCSFAV